MGKASHCALGLQQHEYCVGWSSISCAKCGSSSTHKGSPQRLATACSPPSKMEGNFVTQIGNLHIHKSHQAMWHEVLNVWFCTSCGATGFQKLQVMARPCKRAMSAYERRNMARIACNKMPGNSNLAVAFNRR